jgi:hypothetical protein
MSAPSTGRHPSVVRRQRILAIITVVALLVCVGGAVAAVVLSPPASPAVGQSLPPASVITAPVESRVLTQTVAAPGTVGVTNTVDVYSVVAADPAIVTKSVLQVGDQVTAGQLVAEVAGQPIIVLPGDTPAWRDLTPGDEGADVEQLQRALTGLGMLDDPDLGWYGYDTRLAVAALYAVAGYQDLDEVPLGVVAYVPQLPATVISINAEVGQVVTDSVIMTLATGSPQVQAVAPPGQQVAPGQPVIITDPSTQRRAAGVVDTVGPVTAGDTSATPPVPAGHPVTISSDEIDITWLGAPVSAAIQTGATPQEVLAVPLTAVQTGAGRTYVTVAGTTSRDIDVQTGMVADGYIEVTPSTLGALRAGDRVVVG